MRYCGIDLASKASAVCVMDSEGRIVREEMVPTDADGFRSCLLMVKHAIVTCLSSP